MVTRNLDFDKRRKKKKKKKKEEKEKKFGNSKPRHFQKEMAEAKSYIWSVTQQVSSRWKTTSNNLKMEDNLYFL